MPCRAPHRPSSPGASNRRRRRRESSGRVSMHRFSWLYPLMPNALTCHLSSGLFEVVRQLVCERRGRLQGGSLSARRGMALFWRKRRWRDERWGRNRNWDRSSDSFMRYRKPTFKGMLRDFLIRLVAFTLLCALVLAWVKFHFLDGTLVLPGPSGAGGNGPRSTWSANSRKPAPKPERTGSSSFSF